MESILLALGGIFGVLLFVVLVLVVTVIVLVRIYGPKVKDFLYKQTEAFTQVTTEAQAFARSMVLSVVGTWQAEEFICKATPQLLETLPGKDLNEILAPWQQALGSLVTCGDTLVKENLSAGQGPGDPWNLMAIATATYITEVEFERGKAIIEVQVIKHESLWWANTFNIITENTSVILGQPTTLEAIRERGSQAKKLEQIIDVPAIEPQQKDE